MTTPRPDTDNSGDDEGKDDGDGGIDRVDNRRAESTTGSDELIARRVGIGN
jgi:hypothetical protein